MIVLTQSLILVSCASETARQPQLEDEVEGHPVLDGEQGRIAERVDQVLTALAIRDYQRLSESLSLDSERLSAAGGDPETAGQLAAAILLGGDVERVQLLTWVVEAMKIQLSPDGRSAEAKIGVMVNFRQKMRRAPREVEFVFRLENTTGQWLLTL